MALRLFNDRDTMWPAMMTDQEPLSVFRNMDREMKRMQRDMDHMFRQSINTLPEEDRRAFLERRANDHASSTVEERDGKKLLKYSFDLHNYKPDEIAVKATDNTVTIHAKHEYHDQQGHNVFREYRRHFVLPEGVKAEHLQSKLANSGILAIEAPLPEGHKLALHMEHCIPIQREDKKAIK